MDDKKDKIDIQEIARGANVAYELAFTLLGLMGLFVLLGFLLDKFFKITFFIILGAIVGSVAGFVYIILVAIKMTTKK